MIKQLLMPQQLMFLVMLDQQKAFLKQNDMPTDIVEQLEAQIIGNQASLCSSQKNIKDHFRADNFKTVMDATKDGSLVDSLDLGDDDDIDLQSIDTTIASVAISALMRRLINSRRLINPKQPCPSTSTPTSGQLPKKKI